MAGDSTVADTPFIDKALTKEWLDNFPFQGSYVQTYDDVKNREGGKLNSLSSNFPLTKGRYEKALELSKQGASICFTVNITNGGRKKTDVQKIRCWVCEIDDVSKEAQMDRFIGAPIPPSCLIESKSSYHAYWFAKEGASIENYHLVTGGLRDYFFGDNSVVTDTARVLRIPGFPHQKDPSDPFTVRMEYCFRDAVYSEEEMMQAYPLNTPLIEKKEFKIETDGIWGIISSWDNRDMLDDISGTGLVNGERIEFHPNTDGTQQIIVNGESTGAWIDTQGMIGSTKGGGPTRIQWVMYYNNVNKSALLRRVLERYKDRLPKEEYNKAEAKQNAERQKAKESVEQNFEHITYEEKLIRSARDLISTNPREVIKWGWRDFDYHLGGVYGGKIYLIGAETGMGKSTFANIVCANIAKQGHRVVKYSLEDRLEDKGKEDLFYEVNKLRYRDGKFSYIFTEFYNNEYGHKDGKMYDPEFEKYVQMAIKSLSRLKIVELDKKKQVNIYELETLIKEEAMKGTRVFLIDHLHYFQMSNTERRDLEIQDVMHKINLLVRNYNLAVFLIAHYSNTRTYDGPPHPGMFKDGSAIKQVANIIIQIKSDINTGAVQMYFTKLRGGHRVDGGVIHGQFNVEAYDYMFDKTIEQQLHEQKYEKEKSPL